LLIYVDRESIGSAAPRARSAALDSAAQFDAPALDLVLYADGTGVHERIR
jgi:hypothetical protein